MKKILPFCVSALGGATVSDIFSTWDENRSELSSFINGNKNFFEINTDAQFFIILILIFIVISILYIVFWKLFTRWRCHELVEA